MTYAIIGEDGSVQENVTQLQWLDWYNLDGPATIRLYVTAEAPAEGRSSKDIIIHTTFEGLPDGQHYLTTVRGGLDSHYYWAAERGRAMHNHDAALSAIAAGMQLP